MESSLSSLSTSRESGKAGQDNTIWWLGWLAFHMGDRVCIDWAEVPGLLPKGLIAWPLRLIQGALVVVVLAVSLPMSSMTSSLSVDLYCTILSVVFVVSMQTRHKKMKRRPARMTPVSVTSTVSCRELHAR